ncbi:UPF0664 stress-induced protein C29B12.11c [Erysiphe neolycopersici]|uniref:UPF0664 stress-induced protein C29B12.11c n=1 Tax=Erysiphe neolycopersici TaxID=212602 RepID=A0A420HTY3_9PEZI|nr:UPF0664 stress-induced protein C29B12.11c [Erysiphe neolycopersici]
MSINWVIASSDGQGFVKLPNECNLYTSPPRTSLEIITPKSIAGAPQFSAKSDGGIVYITNQRLVYLPSNPKPALKSFSCPILNLQDAHIRAPFFGANSWFGSCKPVPGGGIPTQCPIIEIKLIFRDGGAFDFHSIYEEIKERLYQAYSVAQETTLHGIDLTNVDLEPLPVYRSAREMREETEIETSPAYQKYESNNSSEENFSTGNEQSRSIPTEAPPDYEELQAQAIHINREQGMRQGAESSPVSTK